MYPELISIPYKMRALCYDHHAEKFSLDSLIYSHNNLSEWRNPKEDIYQSALYVLLSLSYIQSTSH